MPGWPRERRRLLPVLLSLLLALLAIVPGVDAQEVPGQVPPPFGVGVAATGPSDALAPGACGDATATITNTGNSPFPQQHVIGISRSELPEGWQYRTDFPRQVQLPPGESTTLRATVCAPDELQGSEAVQVTVTATVTSDTFQPPATDSATFDARAAPEALLGIDMGVPALAVVLAAILVLILVVLLTRKKQRNAVTISCREAIKEVVPGRGTSFPVRVRNDGSERDLVNLTVGNMPDGWDLFLPLADLALDPREEQTVWLSVRAAEGARPGEEIPIRVTATSTGSGGDQAAIELRTRVIGNGGTSRADELPLGLEQEESVYGAERPVAVKRRVQA